MTTALWTAIAVQMAMGAFDTLFHHEGTERLAWRPQQATELRLHGVRNLAYAILFLALGWSEPRGLWAAALLALLVGELIITLWDFVEEDRTRLLPATERVTHTLLTLNYGVILAMLVPWLVAIAAEPSALLPAWHGVMSWLCLLAALGVIISGIRDLAAAPRCARLTPAHPAPLADGLAARRHVLVTGGTGFVGRRLVEALAAAGHEVTVLTRGGRAAKALTGRVRLITTLDALPDDATIHAMVNLAGEPISDSPWTRRKRMRILRSRLRVTRDVVALIARLKTRPEVLVSGSAIGWYGLRGDQPLAETNLGTDCFSRRICVRWEAAAQPARALGVRLVLLRTGLVLDKCGGMLARMLAPFEFGLGGPFGNGAHWMSWIHRDDLVRMIVHAIATPNLHGPLNGVAPQPVTNRAFSMALGQALHRPAFFAIPAAPLRWLLGGFAEELLLSGQRVHPQAALESGFAFRYPDVQTALAAICGQRGQSGNVIAEPEAPKAVARRARRRSTDASDKWASAGGRVS